MFVVLAATALALRALAYGRYRFDSDEPQHLHVTWGWTAGLLQYRDIFDNHTPLFHMVTAPILALFGERADILLYMRAPILPLFAVVIGCTFAVGRALYDARIGAWAALLLALFPPFFLKSLEYRSDNLWNALWMLALVIVVGRRVWPAEAGPTFLASLLLGAALGASIKTLLLVFAVFVAAVVGKWITARIAIAALLGFLVVPAGVVAYFAYRGALSEMWYGVIGFNSVLAESRMLVWTGRIAFPFVIAAIIVVARRYRHADPRRAFASIITAVYIAALVCVWLLISPRDLLPVMPLLAIFFVAWADRLRLRLLVYSSFAIACVASLYYYADRFENRTDEHITMMHQALRLTRPGEMLMDIKGETIYRRRPFYHAFEIITREQMKRGIIRDTIPERMIETRTYVAQADGPMLPERGRRFLSANFLDMGRLRAAGQWIADDGSFSIAIPGRYVIVGEKGQATGTLDGAAHTGARDLTAGAHRFERSVAGQRVAVLWAPAFERGHSPFHLRDREF